MAPTWTALEAQVRLPARPVPMNPAVDRFVAHSLRIVLKRKSAGDLFGGEVPHFQKVHKAHFKLHVVDEAKALFGSLPAPKHASIRMALVIDFTFVGVALELAPHAGTTFFEYAPDLSARRFPIAHTANDLALGERKMGEMPPGR
jgi:hypothetical protein